MEQYKLNDEIDLRGLGKKVLKIIKKKKKVFTSFLIICFALSTIYFVKVVFIPNYKASFILKSKYVQFDQLKQNIDLYNYHIGSGELNPLSDSLTQVFRNLEILNIDLTEIINKDDLKIKDESNFKLYAIKVIFKSKSNSKEVEAAKNLLIKDLQIRCGLDNDVIVTKHKIESTIIELDSLIKIAYSAGQSYTNKIENSNSSQLMVMNDVYNGINNLITQKLNYKRELSLIENSNIIYQTSQTIISKKVEMPLIVFIICFVVWFAGCAIWIGFEIIFGDSE